MYSGKGNLVGSEAIGAALQAACKGSCSGKLPTCDFPVSAGVAGVPTLGPASCGPQWHGAHGARLEVLLQGQPLLLRLTGKMDTLGICGD